MGLCGNEQNKGSSELAVQEGLCCNNASYPKTPWIRLQKAVSMLPELTEAQDRSAVSSKPT